MTSHWHLRTSHFKTLQTEYRAGLGLGGVACIGPIVGHGACTLSAMPRIGDRRGAGGEQWIGRASQQPV